LIIAFTNKSISLCSSIYHQSYQKSRIRRNRPGRKSKR